MCCVRAAHCLCATTDDNLDAVADLQQGVAGSNPVSPTIESPDRHECWSGLLLCIMSFDPSPENLCLTESAGRFILDHHSACLPRFWAGFSTVGCVRTQPFEDRGVFEGIADLAVWWWCRLRCHGP